jgi:hypothetical protein
METRDKHEAASELVPASIVALGSLACKAARRLKRRLRRRRKRGKENARVAILQFDFDRPVIHDTTTLDTGTAEDSDAAAGNFISATLADTMTLEELEFNGQLANVPPELRLAQGVARENRGAANDPRVGRMFFASHREEFKKLLTSGIRAARDYHEQRRTLKDGSVQSRGETSFLVVILLSMVGGMGTGAVMGCQEVVREIEEELGIHLKVALLCVALGSIRAPNIQRARSNQDVLLKRLVAAAEDVGAVIHHPGALRFGYGRARFDSLIINTNANAHGEIGSLPMVEEEHALLLELLLNTAVGDVVWEQAINIEHYDKKDRCGVQRCVSTTGSSTLSADIDKGELFCTQKLTEGACLSLTQLADDSEEVQSATLDLARTQRVIETEADSAASENVSRPEHLGGQSAGEHVRGLFRQRIPRGSKYRRCLGFESRYDYLANFYIPANVVPMMKDQAARIVEKFGPALDNAVRQFLRTTGGPRKALALCHILDGLLSESATSNGVKLDATSELEAAALERIDDSRRLLARLRRLPFFLRLFRLCAIGRVARELETDCPEALSWRIDSEVRRILSESLFPKLQETVSKWISTLNALVGKLNTVASECSDEGDRLLAVPAYTSAPVGKEFITADFLSDLLVQFRGNKAVRSFCSRFAELLFGTPESVTAALACDDEALRNTIVDQVRPCVVEALHDLDINIDSIVERAYPTELEREALVKTCVQESQGRIPHWSSTDSGENWIKIVAIPKGSRATWLARYASRIDPTHGEWTLVHTPEDEQAYYFLQYCAGLSPRPLFHRKSNPNRRDIRETAASGPDPVSPFFPGPIPTEKDVQLALVKAHTVGVLKIDAEGMVSLDFEHTNERLGRELGEVVRKLRVSHGMLVHIELLFVHEIARDADGLLSRLTALEQKQAGDLMSEFLGKLSGESVRDVIAQVFEQERYLSTTTIADARGGAHVPWPERQN